ncbi:hypothetical protein KJ975_11850 [Myxococcota bacterium]|nr:hypothetical protein [Myxococcota bacterium]
MTRIIALGSSQPALTAHALYPYRNLFRGKAHEGPYSWGLAMCRPPDEIEHKRRPLQMDEVDLFETIQHWHPEYGLAHIQIAHESRPPGDISPFRYRNWFFSMLGGSSRHARMKEWLQSSIKGDLRWNIPGNTEQELVFHLFLVFLKETCQLGAYDCDHQAVAIALAQTYRNWRQMARDVEEELIPAVLTVTNGRMLMAYCSQDDIGGYRHVQGIHDPCPYCRDHIHREDRENTHPHLDTVLIVGDLQTAPAARGLSPIPRDQVLFYHSNHLEWIPV